MMSENVLKNFLRIHSNLYFFKKKKKKNFLTSNLDNIFKRGSAVKTKPNESMEHYMVATGFVCY